MPTYCKSSFGGYVPRRDDFIQPVNSFRRLQTGRRYPMGDAGGHLGLSCLAQHFPAPLARLQVLGRLFEPLRLQRKPLIQRFNVHHAPTLHRNLRRPRTGRRQGLHCLTNGPGARWRQDRQPSGRFSSGGLGGHARKRRFDARDVPRFQTLPRKCSLRLGASAVSRETIRSRRHRRGEPHAARRPAAPVEADGWPSRAVQA